MRLSLTRSNPRPARRIALGLGVGRLALGAGFLAAPVTSVSMLGVDTVTAGRMAFLARMTAARDAVLGAGLIVEVTRNRPAAGWLLAGVGADVADALLIGAQARAGRLDPLKGGSTAVGALGIAALGVWAARELS